MEEKGINKESGKTIVVNSQQKKSKKKIIIMAILIVAIGLLVYFMWFRNSSNKTIVFYRYQDKIFLKNSPFYKKRNCYEDIDKSKLKEYTYHCQHKYCNAFSLEDQKSLFDDSIDGTWVLISDSNTKENTQATKCVEKKDNYVLYNVETQERYLVPLDSDMCPTDILKDSNGIPKSVVAKKYGRASGQFVFEVNTGNLLMDTDDLIVGLYENYLDLKVTNNGKKDLYIVDGQYNNSLLYDENFNYISDIKSSKYFGDEGNIIKISKSNKNSKEKFYIYDLQGKLIHTSKEYDRILVDNGYLITINNGVVNIINSQEKVLVEISKNGKKYNYSVDENQYYGKEGFVSVFEGSMNEDNKVKTQYLYSPIENKLSKNTIDFDGLYSYSALSVYFSNGFTTYKVSNTTVYLDNELIDSKKDELKQVIDNLSKDSLGKKLLTAKQNIYLYTEYDYLQYNWKAFAKGIYSPLAIPVDDTTNINEIVRLSGINYYNTNSEKLKNEAFQKLYNLYYKYFDAGYAHAINDTYYEPGFFGVMMELYFSQESSLGNYSLSSNGSGTIYSLQKDNKEVEFKEAVKNYIEKYVLK